MRPTFWIGTVLLAGLLALALAWNHAHRTAASEASNAGERAALKLFAAFKEVTDPELQVVINRAALRLRNGRPGNDVPELRVLFHTAGLTSEQLSVIHEILAEPKSPQVTSPRN